MTEHMLAELLKKRGMSEDQIEHIFYKNVMRLYKELL
jgi:microsomal dipeptidase-like Zn-dependent dipeptidase